MSLTNHSNLIAAEISPARGGAGVTVSDATAQMFDPADPDRLVKAFLPEDHP